jgi:hypothetical protein
VEKKRKNKLINKKLFNYGKRFKSRKPEKGQRLPPEYFEQGFCIHGPWAAT